MTDERMLDVERAVARLPKGAGVVFRHHATPGRERRRLFDRVRAIARRRRLMLLLAATPAVARNWGADGAHNRSSLASRGVRTVAVHSARELVLAQRVCADLVFVSPVFPTQSHRDVRVLETIRLGLLLGNHRDRAIALGGMNARHFRELAALKLYGWAAIDALA